MHSYNARRSGAPGEQPSRLLVWLKRVLLFIGLVCCGFYVYRAADLYVYQAYEDWAFEQAIAGRSSVTLVDFLRAKFTSEAPAGTRSSVTPEKPSAAASGLAEGDLVARLTIKRLHIESIVREGVSAATLRVAVGHVPTTALPGMPGNFAIAAHRDTLFRALKDIREGDEVTVQSLKESYVYQVVATKIVSPSDVSVLRADGGGLYRASGDRAPAKLLTMITCYPFYYVGSAPKRFVVECRLISSSAL